MKRVVKKPKMILFDYGQTLLCEPDSDFLRGEEALFGYIKSNRNNLTPMQVCDFSKVLFERVKRVRDLNVDIHEWQFLKFLYEYLEIELSISYPEAEKIFWNHVSAGALMPNADVVIAYIKECGIRSGVISNLMFSSEALQERINRMLPDNHFEFIIATSQYIFRKPDPLIFELALRKAGLNAEDVWFCGDNVRADVDGAAAVGIFPVWYDNKTVMDEKREPADDVVPSCEHLHIHDWLDLIDVLGRAQ